MRSQEAAVIHKQIESLPKVSRFLSSLSRSSRWTSNGYKTGLAYFHDFLSKQHNYDLETIIPPLLSKEKDVYSLLDDFLEFIQGQVNTSSIHQYLTGIRSYLSYCDVDIVPLKFKHRVKIPKICHEEEQALDVSDIRQILLNCHNRRLKAYLLVLASGGLRAVEACAIRLRDINFNVFPTTIHVRKEFAKTRVARDIYVSDEAAKYLKDWITFKYGPQSLAQMTDRTMAVTHTHHNSNRVISTEKALESLVFQVQLNNEHVTPQSVYRKMIFQFQSLLGVSGFDQRKEGMKRRRITFHSFRRFVKTVLSDSIGKEYSEWFLGHAKSSYYVNKPEIRASTYAEKAMKYLTFLDYSTLEASGKSIEAKLREKDRELQNLKEKYETEIESIREETNQKFNQIMVMIQQNPQLAQIKPEVLKNKTLQS